MRICLVTAPTVTEFCEAEASSSHAIEEAALEPQLGALSLAAVLLDSGDVVHIVNLNHLYRDEVLRGRTPASSFVQLAAERVAAANADLYGFSSICSTYPTTLRVVEAVKATCQAPNVIGGPQASVVDVGTLREFPYVDFVLRGEAEVSLPDLITALQKETALNAVRGLTWRSPFGITRNPDALLVADLDALPIPAYKLTGELRNARKAPIELGRGCPFECTFCSTNDFFRRKFRLCSPEKVIKQMRDLNQEYGINHFELVHDMFTVDRKRVEKFATAMLASSTSFTWSCSARTDSVDAELLSMMAAGGCTGIFFGVESGSDRIQKNIHKNLDLQKAKAVIADAERIGISTTVSLIVGFPEEESRDVSDTIRMFMFAARQRKSDPQLNILAPLAGTPIYEKYRTTLVLDELCSDISRQSIKHDEVEGGLVRRHPNIFPNFYLISPQFLETECLLELREFSLIAIERFRWLLVAIERISGDLYEVFLEWRQYRRRRRGEMKGYRLRSYYRRDFKRDFLDFVRGHTSLCDRAAEALIAYEDAAAMAMEARQVEPTGQSADVESGAARTKGVILSKDTLILELPFRLQTIIASLKAGEEVILEAGCYYYATSMPDYGDRKPVWSEVSDWMGVLLRYCARPRTMCEVEEELIKRFPAITDYVDHSVTARLLEAALAQHFLIRNP